MRVRGLKFEIQDKLDIILPVAPHAGAWIEIWKEPVRHYSERVAPHAGAWIEIRSWSRR